MAFQFLTGPILQTTGYLSLIIINFIGCASIIFPVPNFLSVFTMGAVMNPFLVALFSSIGAAFGELIGYGVGYGGKRVIKRGDKYIKRAKRWMKEHSGFLVIIIFSATPLPTDIIGILCGAMKYDIKKFFLAVWIGRFLMYLVLAYAGYYGITWVTKII
ncbi:MAG: DedA family protein [Candidatus Aenigmarchaeota archaeon]|nr:DedA family protein [Candidatus Aenigmarchaeota archaeon]